MFPCGKHLTSALPAMQLNEMKSLLQRFLNGQKEAPKICRQNLNMEPPISTMTNFCTGP